MNNNKHPTVTPYKYKEELEQLRDWFYKYNEQSDLRSRALQKCAAYMTRGNMPHSIEATSLLTSSRLLDEKLSGVKKATNKYAYQDEVASDLNVMLNEENAVSYFQGDSQLDESSQDYNTVQLSYTMSIIKFVNGLLDPYQKSTYAMSLNRLAEFLKLPTFFVELRHIGTHEFLPSVEMLREGCDRALEWLWVNYWCVVLNSADISNEMYSENNETPGKLNDAQNPMNIDTSILESYNKLLEDLNREFKNLRKIRKDDMNKIYKFGDSSEVGLKYWKSVNFINNLIKSSGNNNKDMSNDSLNLIYYFLLVKDFLIFTNKEISIKKINGLRFLYRPILEEFGSDFNLNFFKFLLNLLNYNSDQSQLLNNLNIIFYDISKNFENFVKYDMKENDNTNRDLIFNFKTNKFNKDQAFKWCEYLLSNNLKFNKKRSKNENFINNESINQIYELLCEENTGVNVDLLEILLETTKTNKNNINKNIVGKIEDSISNMKKFQIPDLDIDLSIDDVDTNLQVSETKRIREEEAGDDITNYIEEAKKRMKIGSESSGRSGEGGETELFVWETHESWQPAPFGVEDL
ncbi:hypothetical protein B5S31_g3085 [[Candida] boidinii]|uniref:Unnamed protein product n=1 Tax=Candida boidinii TaxID=5477 RepID=A0ACB5TF37_CANBO|nr:hypothetical protein B5S29_g3400 [[Candida] boidinii]OWB73347.1 hypothetical protein B5S31_g3085 [[Candida] boidinii]GME87609.1 unnamed protein product [[Candida] boidinii]